MARLADTVTLIFYILFLISYAHLKPKLAEYLVTKRITSSSNDLLVPDSASKVATFLSNHLIESATQHKILLPTDKPKDTAIVEPTEIAKLSAFYEIAILFHLHRHHLEEEAREREREVEKQFETPIAGEEILNGDDMIKTRMAGSPDGKFVHHHKPVGDGEGMMRFKEGKKKLHKKGWKKEKEDGEGMRRFDECKMKRHKKKWKKEKESKTKRHKEWKK